MAQTNPNPSASFPVVALAEARLQASPYKSIQKIVCVYHEGSLVLRGCLPTFFHKQMAQQAVVDIMGVKQVDNQIKVLD
jgi:osmotically-inducible protein OsmY